MKPRSAFLLTLLLVAAVAAIAGALWIQRGFRASATPTALEASVARKIRNFATPRSLPLASQLN